MFGKNTTAGAFNIITRKPGFKPGASFEVSYGNYGFIQAKSSVTGNKDTKAMSVRFMYKVLIGVENIKWIVY